LPRSLRLTGKARLRRSVAVLPSHSACRTRLRSRAEPFRSASQGRLGMQRAFASATTLVALAVMVSSAGAADLSRRPPPPSRAPPVYAPVPHYNWTGFYIGINGGGAWGGRSRFDLPGSPSARLDVSGWVAGGTLGGNYQLGHFVFGLEGDVDAADIHGSTACLG